MRRSWPLLAIVLLTVILAAPQRVAACTCTDIEPGEVAFIGTVMPRSLLQLLVPEATDIGGTQPFQVTSVLFGNPGDGRVFSPRNSCGKWFEAGATYLVHAIRIEDGEPFMERPEVPLVTHSCLVGDRLRPADPGASITRLGIGASIVGLAGLGLWLLLRPTREGPVQS